MPACVALTRPDARHRHRPRRHSPTVNARIRRSVRVLPNTGLRAGTTKEQGYVALVVFLVIALIAAIFGFGGIAASAVGIAKILFFVFAIMAVVSFILGLVKRG